MKLENRLKDFDEIFDTDTLKNIKFNNMKLLKKMFNLFQEELYTPSDEYRKILHNYNILTEEFLITLTPKQQKKFDNLSEIRNQMFSEKDEQLFIFGYIMAKELDKEINLNK